MKGSVAMNIALPNKFFYSAGERDRAFVDKGILYIEGRVNFEDLMYTITYSMKGYDTCLYCGNELPSNKKTIDHMYPRYFGGVSIPDNLLPCCHSCNSTKSCLTTEQFLYWRKLKSKRKKDRMFKEMVATNQRKYQSRILLPDEWISYYDITTVLKQLTFDEVSQATVANQKIEMFYYKNHHYPKPIVVSVNGWVFAGIHIIYHAKNHSINVVPAIVLDNVAHLSH